MPDEFPKAGDKLSNQPGGMEPRIRSALARHASDVRGREVYHSAGAVPDWASCDRGLPPNAAGSIRTWLTANAPTPADDNTIGPNDVSSAGHAD